MKQILRVTVLLMAVSSPALGQAKKVGTAMAGGSVEQTLLRTEDEWAQAYVKRDPAPLRRILADDYVGTSARGTVRNKAQEITEVTASSDTAQSATNEDMKVHVYGNAAVVTGRGVETGRNKDGAYTRRFRFTDTFVKRGGRWQCVASHGSPIVEQP
jgi:ketosteroid isomerase-like protein